METLPVEIQQEILVYAISASLEQKLDVSALLLVNKTFRKNVLALKDLWIVAILSLIDGSDSISFTKWNIDFIRDLKSQYHPTRKLANALFHYLVKYYPKLLKRVPIVSSFNIYYYQNTIEQALKMLPNSSDDLLYPWCNLLEVEPEELDNIKMHKHVMEELLQDFKKLLCADNEPFVRINGNWFQMMNEMGNGRDSKEASFIHIQDARLDVLRNESLAFYPYLEDKEGQIHTPNENGIFETLKKGETYLLYEEEPKSIVKFHAKGFTKLSKRPLVAPARYNMRVFTNLHTLTQDAEFEAWKVNFPHNEIEEIKCDFLLVTGIYPSVKRISCVAFMSQYKIFEEHIGHTSMMGNNAEEYPDYPSNRGINFIKEHFPNVETLHLKYPRVIWGDSSRVRAEYLPLETDCQDYLSVPSIEKFAEELKSLRSLIIDYPLVKNQMYPVIMQFFLSKK